MTTVVLSSEIRSAMTFGSGQKIPKQISSKTQVLQKIVEQIKL